MSHRPAIRRAASQRGRGPEKAARFNVLPQAIDDTLYDAFGQRQVSTIFTQLNQYRSFSNRTPFQVTPESLDKIYVKSSTANWCPWAPFATVRTGTARFPSSIKAVPGGDASFNLRPGSSLGEAWTPSEGEKEMDCPKRW